MGALIERFLSLDENDEQRLEPVLRPVLRNWNGVHVGTLSPSAVLTGGA